jgi:hypothetical protein
MYAEASIFVVATETGRDEIVVVETPPRKDGKAKSDCIRFVPYISK